MLVVFIVNNEETKTVLVGSVVHFSLISIESLPDVEIIPAALKGYLRNPIREK